MLFFDEKTKISVKKSPTKNPKNELREFPVPWKMGSFCCRLSKREHDEKFSKKAANSEMQLG